jgi:hypothetical protein
MSEFRFPSPRHAMSEPAPIPVFIRNPAGEYLAGDGDHWFFTTDRTQARVFDYSN